METLRREEQLLFGVMIDNSEILESEDLYELTYKSENTFFKLNVDKNFKIKKVLLEEKNVNILIKKLEYRLVKSNFINNKIKKIINK